MQALRVLRYNLSATRYEWL